MFLRNLTIALLINVSSLFTHAQEADSEKLSIVLEGARFNSSTENYSIEVELRSGFCTSMDDALLGQLTNCTFGEIRCVKDGKQQYAKFSPGIAADQTKPSSPVFEAHFCSDGERQVFHSPRSKSLVIYTENTKPLDNPLPGLRLTRFKDLERDTNDSNMTVGIGNRTINEIDLIVATSNDNGKIKMYGFDPDKSFFHRWYKSGNTESFVDECIEVGDGSWFPESYREIVEVKKNRFYVNEFKVTSYSFRKPQASELSFDMAAGTQFHEAGNPLGASGFEEMFEVNPNKILELLELTKKSSEKIRENHRDKFESFLIAAPGKNNPWKYIVLPGAFAIGIWALIWINRFKTKLLVREVPDNVL